MTIQNETLDILARRHTCRAFANQEVEQEKLEAIARAGVQSPSSNNLQGWRISVVSDKAFIDKLDEYTLEGIKATNPQMYDRLMSRGGKALYNTPVFVAIAVPKSAQYSVDLDSGIVCQNMAIAATALGLGSCINRVVSAGILGVHKQEVYEALNIPENYEFSIGLLVGYAQEQGTPHMPDEEKITFINKV